MPKKKSDQKKKVEKKETMKKEEKVILKDLDKQLEDILGKETIEMSKEKIKEVENYIRENPLQAVTVALLLGLIIGRLKR